MNSPVVEALTRARKLLDTKGWIQESYSNSDGFCSLGALREVLWRPLQEPVMTKAQRLLVEAGADGNGISPFARIATWNDEEGRTKEEVLSVFDKAIEIGSKKEQS